MALGAPQFLGGDGIGSTGSLNVICDMPLGETIYVFASGHRNASIAPPSFTISDTDGHVWTTVMDQVSTTGSPRMRGMVFQTVGLGTTASTVSITTAVGSLAADVVSFPGADTDFSNSNFGPSPVGDPSATISAVTAGNGSFVVGHFFGVGVSAVTTPPGFTELVNYSTGTTIVHDVGYALTLPPTTASWTTTNAGSVAIMFEIKSAGGAPDITGTLDATLAGGYIAEFTGIVQPLPPVAPPPGGGGYRKPIIYVDDNGRPVDLKTYKARTANEVIQAAKATEPRRASKALARAILGKDNEEIAAEARRLAEATANARLAELLFKLEQLAIREAQQDEDALLMLLIAS